ncbi:MAG TPA: universal stress protein [Micromonosporaceae bacterium]
MTGTPRGDPEPTPGVGQMDEFPIIAGYEGSPPAQAALRWALDEGVRRGLPVRILHVVDPESRLVRGSAGWRESMHGAADRAVRRVAAEAEDWGRLGIAVTGAAVDGPVAGALCAQSGRASLLVLGNRGLGGFPGQRIGSVSLAVATHALCPVVIIREGMCISSARPIGVGVDDGEQARLALGFAFDEAAVRGVDLVAVRGWHPPGDVLAHPPGQTGPATHQADAVPADQAFDEARHAEQQLLDHALAPWRDRYPEVTVIPRLIPVTATHALTVASREVQLMVVGARGTGGFPGLCLGSVSHQLLHHAVASVMVVRPVAGTAGIKLRTGAGRVRPALVTT